MDLVMVEGAAMCELHLTVTSTPGESLAALAGRVGDRLKSHDATVVRQMVFGSVAEQSATVAAFKQALNDPQLPVTWVEGAAGGGGPIAGLQIHAIAGTPVRTLSHDDRVVGRVWRDPVATHCVLSDLGPVQTTGSRPEQASETFERLQAGLALAGMNLREVARTWFFLDDILSWYGDFNRVRTDIFARHGLRPGMFPASTGIAGRNAAGAALTAAVWAVQPLDPTAPAANFVASPRQCPAPAYGSSFSRAVEINSAGFRQLLVSGTASISPDGRTAHAGDVGAQIELTMAAVAAILESRRMSAADVSRATAYFKSAGDQPRFESWRARSAWSGLPVINTWGNICRDDLRFEIELDAIQAGSGGR
jgi:enamine deaminase RidA (YjgF/YER057c/UK114 family)